MHLSREEFEGLVAEAIDGLPEEFAEKIDNVEFLVEDAPRAEHYDGIRLPPGRVLLGLYQGVPLTRRSPWSPYQYPDRIFIFQRPIEQVCRTREDVIYQVQHTVLHEIAHHFGISDARLQELGY
jgi:predicted Zn-dependent protease with MMP-like domain